MASLRAQAIALESLTAAGDDGIERPEAAKARTLRLILVAAFLIAALLMFAVPFLSVIF